MKTTLRITKAYFLVLSCLMLLCLSRGAMAQTTLVAGDIAFTGYNSNNNGSGGQNDFSFVILRSGGISAGTTINFTDNGYKGTTSNALGTTEGTLVWSSSTAMAQFTQVYIRIEPNAGASVLSLSAGSIAGGFSNFILSQAGDQIFAYQGTSASPTFIAGIHMNNESATATSAAWDNLASGTSLNSSRSDIPPALTNGVNAIMVVPSPSTASSEKDNGVYNCTGSSGANVAAIAAAINNVANWNIQDVTLYTIPPSCSFSISSPLSATTSFTNATCNGVSNGRASVSASGGAGGYTYSWAPSGGSASLATGLSAGTYTVTVTDAASASVTATVTIGQPSAIVATPGFTNASCNGVSNGRASVSVTGGISPYFYSWAPSGGTASLATGLAAGTYTCTITDNNSCVKTQVVTVSQPSAITAAVTMNSVSCNGGSNGSASVSVSGGTPSYFYSWAPSGGTGSTASGLSAGNYTVTVTDNNSCTRTATTNVTQPSAIVTSTAVTNVACNGGANGVASISASGGAGGYTYLWSTGSSLQTITGLMAGVYTATVTDANSCKSIKSASVSQPSALVTSTAVTNVACNGGANGVASISASGGAGGYSYLWSTGSSLQTITGLVAGVYTATVTDANSCTSIKSALITQPPAITTSTTVTNANCNGASTGAASVAVSGGAGGYTYSWTPSGGTSASATGLAAGNYTVTITDANSCVKTAFASVSQPAAMLTSTTVTNVSCNGGTNGAASVSVSGGAGSYTYSWTPSGGTAASATGLAAGNYTVTITDAGSCVKTAFANVTQPSALVTSTAVTNISCNGGTNGVASVSVSGGAGGYTYSWAPSGGTASTATGLAVGNYTVTVTDANSCTKTAFANVTQPAALVTSTTVTNVSCNGGSNGVASVSVSGGAGGYTYSWTPSGGTAASATGLVAGNYTVTVTDANSCIKTAFATISQPSAILTSTSATNVSCNGGSNGSATVTASGGTGSLAYNWTPSGGSAATASGLAAGNYTVTVTDANSCTKTAFVTIGQPSAILTTTTVTNVSCNGGSNGVASVSASGGTGSLSYSWSPSGGTAASATGLTAGNYTVTVTDVNGCTKTALANVTQPAALATTTTITNVSCNGGSNGTASVTVSGGAGGYIYSWTPSGGISASASGLAAGNYTVTVTDANSCIKTALANITQPSAIVATPSQTNATCGSNNGAASVSVAGGTGSYTYSWVPSGGTGAAATGLSAGNYTVSISDANSCIKTHTFAITASGNITGVVSTTSVSCNGGNNGVVSIAATGGTGAYTYTWMPGSMNTPTVTGLTAGIYTVQVKDATSCTVSFTANVNEPAILTATLSLSNITCNGSANGSLAAVVAGGTGAYTYTWSPSGGNAATAAGLSPGTYTLQVRDANMCVYTRTVSLTEPPALSAVVSGTNVACNGGSNGSAVVLVGGGVGSYTYSWTPSGGTTASATGLAAGNYTVTVKDANLCTVTRSISITQPTLLSAVTSQTNITCNGAANGTASVIVSGGTGSYTYSWTPSGGTGAAASGLSANNYTVTVKDANNCSIARSFTITEPAVLMASISATNASCNGSANGVATANVSGGTGAYTYTWSPSGGNAATAAGLAAGAYNLSVKDANNCTASQTFTITQPVALTATVITTNVSCNGAANGSATVTAAGGTGAYTYTWSPAGGNASMANTLAAANYSVMLSDANNCMLTQTLSISEPAAILATISHTNISCFGQTNGAANVTASGGTGVLTYSWMPGGNTTAAISNLTAGTYTVMVKDASNCQRTATVGIVEPAAITHTQSLSICQGQSVTVGTSTYTAAGTYTNVLNSAAGCDSTVTTILTISPPPSLTVTASSTTVCAGTSVVLTATGATTYAWTSGVTNGIAFMPASTQTYTVTGNNSGCASTATISVQVNPKPTVMANATATLVCSGSAVTLSGSGAATYSWTGGVSNGTAFSPTATASYTVTGTNASACSNTAVVTVSVAPCTGLQSHGIAFSVSVNPNPVSSNALISIPEFDRVASGTLSLDIYDNTGRLVKTLMLTQSETLMSREGLADGLYYYHLTANGATLLKGKLMVQ